MSVRSENSSKILFILSWDICHTRRSQSFSESCWSPRGRALHLSAHRACGGRSGLGRVWLYGSDVLLAGLQVKISCAAFRPCRSGKACVPLFFDVKPPQKRESNREDRLRKMNRLCFGDNLIWLRNTSRRPQAYLTGVKRLFCLSS
jgi:hypothetical protein